MRLFVAVWPSAEVIRDLTAAVAAAEANASSPPLRWVTATQLHLTLAFLGEVADPCRADLERRLERAASRHPSVQLQLCGAGRFGDRVLYLKVDGDRERLRRLAASVAAAARRADIAVGERTYRAHLTLARAAPSTDLRPLVTVFAGYTSRPWTTSEVHLVHSRLGAGPGGRSAYETVATWPLNGGDPR